MSVITLSGKNEYELQQARRELIQEYKKSYGDLSLYQLDMADSTLNELSEAVLAVPFLASTQLVLLSGIADQKSLHDEFMQLVEKVPDSTTLLIVEPKLDKRTALYKFLSTKTDFREFKDLDENGLIRWVMERAEKAQVEISRADAAHLVRRVGEEQWLLSGELDKLLSLNERINRELIDGITVAHPRETIFQLLDAIASQRTNEALKIYSALRKADTEPHYILSMIIWQMQNMTIVHAAGQRNDNEIAKDFKMSPYVVGKTRTAVKDMSKQQLMRLQQTLIDIDKQLKSSALNAELAVEQLIVKLSS